jgi:hypothetical protein
VLTGSGRIPHPGNGLGHHRALLLTAAVIDSGGKVRPEIAGITCLRATSSANPSPFEIKSSAENKTNAENHIDMLAGRRLTNSLSE